MARSTKSIDSLSIEITANAQSANQALETLIRNVSTLGNTLNGVDTKTFTNGIKEIGTAVGGVKLNDFQRQISKASKSLGDYARRAQTGARQTQTFSSAFRHIRAGVTNLFAGLSQINSKINEFASKIRRANKESKNFAQTVGLLYARFFLLIRGAKALMGAVKSSMNYIEVLNYFDASFGQVAERGVDKWSEMGYDSAEAYYDSFAERAKKVTGDMSGFFPEKNGTLTPTGMQSLGMNPQQLMQYQSQFAQMSSSMGTTSEQALKLSEVLTKIGADLASVKNMEFEDVWKDMASGLVGMSRTLDKYGVNIRNANMEMKLHELGINATVKSLSQADKALLRTIILLDSATYSWADLAETLNTPANQFRMLANNVKLLGQMIGNIFLPIVAKILPYLNAFVIVLQRLFSWLAKILGIDLSALMGKNQGYDNSNLSDMLDDAENLSDALEDDTKSAKKLKKQLQGFDALNNLTTKDDDSKANPALASGLLDKAFMDAAEKYLQAWRDAFDKLQNDAEKLADKIQAFFMRLTAPIRKAWEKVGNKVITQWKNAAYNLKWLFKRIAKDFWRVWEQPETERIFENIFTVFGNIGEVVDWLAKRFNQAWAYNDNGFRILQAIRDIILIISDKAKEMSQAFVEWSKDLDLKPLLSKMAEFLEEMKPVVASLMEVLKDFLHDVLLPLAKWTVEKGLPKLLQVFIDFKNKVNWEKLIANLKKLWEHLEPFAEKIGEGFIMFLDKVAQGVAEFFNSKKFEDFLAKLEKWMDDVTPRDIANFFEKLAKGIIGLKFALFAFNTLKPIAGILSGIFSIIASVKIARNIRNLTNAVEGLSSTTKSVSGLSKALTSLGGFKGLMTMDLGTIFGAGTATEIGVTLAAGIAGSFIAAIGGFHLGKALGKAITGDDELYDSFTWTGKGGFFEALKDETVIELENTKKNVSAGLKAIGNQFTKEYENMKTNVSAGGKAIKDAAVTEFNTMETNVSAGIQAIKDDINSLSNISEYDRFEAGLDYIDKKLSDLANKPGNINTAFAGFAVDLSIKLMNIKDTVVEWKDGIVTKFYEAGINIGIELSNIQNTVLGWKDNFIKSFYEFGINLGIKLVEIQNKFAELKNNISGKLIELGINAGIELYEIYNKFLKWKEDVKVLFDPEAWLIVFNGIEDGLKMAWNNIASWFNSNIMPKIQNTKNKIISIVDSIKKILSKLNFNFSMNTKLEQHGKLPSFKATGRIYANGGFPEDGVFFANHEELVGKFENGKTAVANNEQIVSGIQNGVYGAMSESNALLMEQNSLLQAILEKETGINANDIFKSVQRSASNYSKQYGKPAFN